VLTLYSVSIDVASAKTAIKETSSVLKELSDGRARMDEIEVELKSKSPPRLEKASHMLEEFANELIA